MNCTMMLLSLLLVSVRGFHNVSPSKSGWHRMSPLMAKRSQSKMAPRIGEFWETRMDGWRPTVNDVERISWGKPAKKKGTGSRGVPHRLNEDERFLFDQARRRGYLEIQGSGWRSQRREAPLLNTYRSLCDARGQASVVLHKQSTGVDALVVDISPLRNPQQFEAIAEYCLKQHMGGEMTFQGSGMEESTDGDLEENDVVALPSDDMDSWATEPIYHLPPFCLAWELARSDAKSLAKEFATIFDTVEGKRAPSKKPTGVKPGKGRRHGGYGIG